MHVQMGCYLLLSIPIFLHSINDCRVAFAFVCDNLFREYFFKVWPVHLPMTLGYFRNVLVFSDVRDQALNKIILSQDGLSLDLSPDRFFADPLLDELTVFLLCFGSLSAELPKYPIDGQARRRRFSPCCGPVAGPLPLFRLFNHPCPDGI
jgi:hypothetical protein